MTLAASVTRVIDIEAILLTPTGPVHREVGGHLTSCGASILNNAQPVTPAQVAGFDLKLCVQCFPDQHRRGGNRKPRGGRHRA